MVRAIVFIVIFAFPCCLCTTTSVAQNPGSVSASQTVRINLQPLIDISFGDRTLNSDAGIHIDLNHHNRGKHPVSSVSPEYGFEVKSNTEFKVSVQTSISAATSDGNTFAKTRNAIPTSADQPAPAVPDKYSVLASSKPGEIPDEEAWKEQGFALKYQAPARKPYTEDNYDVSVVYTASQP